ncbi:MAG TPA: spore germination protein [Limnochordales bacterium]
MRWLTPQPIQARSPQAGPGQADSRQDGKASASLEERIRAVAQPLGADRSFDVIVRRFQAAGRPAALIHLDGFLRPTPTVQLLKSLMAGPEELARAEPRRALEQRLVPFFEVQWVGEPQEAVHQVLCGQAALVVDGLAEYLLVDLRQYPSRAVAEPDLERVTRGARDGFTETGLTNVNLIRRRLRDPHLRVETFRVGLRSGTDVFLLHVEGLAPTDLVEELRRKLKEIRADALPMGSRNLEEYLVGAQYNPLPRVRYTERPDVAASHLLEGYAVILVDTSPAAMILPANVWQFTQHAEEYVQVPMVGTYLRWVRFVAILMSVVLVPLWLALASHRQGLPPWLEWVGPKKSTAFPLWLQMLLLHLGLDIIRMALIHTPTALATSIGLVGAVLLGQFAVQAGLFTNEALLYSALAAIGSFTTPALEFALAMRFLVYPLIGLAALFGLWGVAAGLAALVYLMAFTRSFSLPYLWPLFPFHGEALSRLLFRYPIPAVRTHRAPSPRHP